MHHPILLQCPKCGCEEFDTKNSSSIVCGECKSNYPINNNILEFVDNSGLTQTSFQQQEMTNSGTLAKIYNFGKKIVNSEFLAKDQIKEFVSNVAENEIIVELGCGNRRLVPNIINVDLFPFPNVDMTMDIHHTGFRSNSIDYIVLDCVLEHVSEPQKVIDEAYRILKEGGKIICTAPWIFPYHGYPKNFYNISKDGHKLLFSTFSKMEMEMHHGPSAALTNLVSEYFALAFSGKSQFLYTVFKGCFLLPIFWFKYLDIFWQKNRKAIDLASTICIVATK